VGAVVRGVRSGADGGRGIDKKVVFPVPLRYTTDDVLLLQRLVEAGTYRAVIDRRHTLDDVVEATRYVETRQNTGNVVRSVHGGR
jgi:NADPH:quinone reductase-like Zn-dependent oxidoreductase